LIYYYYDSIAGAFHLKDEYSKFPSRPVEPASPYSKYSDSSFQSSLALSRKYLPSLCPDGETYGFNDLTTLRNAIKELSDSYSLAVEVYLSIKGITQEHLDLTNESPDIIIEEPPTIPQHVKDFLNIAPDPFVICPRVHLQSSRNDKHEAIYIDAEDVTISCDSCMIDVKGTHFAFGPLAKHVLIKGLALVGATETSLTFRHDGASAVFEDCFFYQNRGFQPHGSVLDMNSTSTVEFRRCYVIDTTSTFARGSKRLVTIPSFTLRNKEPHVYHHG
jgi:hypothetical protein